MGDALSQNQRYSVEAYEALAANAGEGERYEYADGQLVVKDEYTSDEHNLVLLNVYRLLHAQFGPKGCKCLPKTCAWLLMNIRSFACPT
jgi:hypothetical protein